MFNSMVTLAVVLLVASLLLDAMVFGRTGRRQFYIEDDIDEESHHKHSTPGLPVTPPPPTHQPVTIPHQKSANISSTSQFSRIQTIKVMTTKESASNSKLEAEESSLLQNSSTTGSLNSTLGIAAFVVIILIVLGAIVLLTSRYGTSLPRATSRSSRRRRRQRLKSGKTARRLGGSLKSKSHSTSLKTISPTATLSSSGKTTSSKNKPSILTTSPGSGSSLSGAVTSLDYTADVFLQPKRSLKTTSPKLAIATAILPLDYVQENPKRTPPLPRAPGRGAVASMAGVAIIKSQQLSESTSESTESSESETK